jgi:hypothetical protein
MCTLVRRTALLAGIACAFVVLLAAPASAHTISGPRPTNFRTRIVSIEPPIPGVTVRVVDLGAKTELTNNTDGDVIVLGYEGEPYLKIGPSGVYENVHSAATYINRTRQGGTVPAGVDTSPTATPEWHKVGDGRTASWHDHRAHFMGNSLPPVVQSSPDKFHHISVGHIKLQHDGKTTDVTVALDWVPGPSGLPWIPVILVAFGIALAAALARWWRTLASIIGLLVVVDAAHTITYELARPGGFAHRTGQFLGGSFVSIIVWVVAVPTMIGLWKRRTEAWYGAIFVGLMVALVGGATDLSALWKSQLPAVGPDWLVRLEVALALGAGAGVAVGSLISLIRTERATRATRAAAQPQGWIGTLVVGLSDNELRHIAADLDVDEVLDAALADLAARCTPVADRFDAGALVIDVAAPDDAGRHTRSLVAREARVVVEPDRAEAVGAELGVAFPLLLQLLAGTRTLDDARTAGRVTTSGDEELLAAVASRFAERAAAATAPADDPAPAT